jgi:hypothetical protein
MRKVAAVALAAVLAAPTLAQEAPKPGPEHKLLARQAGTWDTTMKFGDMEVKGTATFKMDLGGLWLVGTLESKLFGQKFSGRSLDSYNPARKKFVSVWVDSMGTAPLLMEGTFDKETKTLTMTGEGPGMDGKPIRFRSVSRMPDADTLVMKMYMGPGKEPAFTVTYRRKK